MYAALVGSAVALIALSSARIDPKPVFGWTTQGPGGNAVSHVAADATDSARVYASMLGYQGRLYRSANGGRTWHPLGASAPLQSDVLYADPTRPDVLFAASYQGFFRSSDGGNEWTRSQQFQGGFPNFFHALASSPSDPDTLYLSHNEAVYRSDDSGSTWTWASQGLNAPGSPGAFFRALAVDSDDSEVVLAGGPGVFRSTDGGSHWSRVGLEDRFVTALTFTGSGTLVAATENGVFRSPDAGESWEAAGLTGIQIDGLESLNAEPPSLYAWARDSQGVLFHTFDLGDHWQPVEGPFERFEIQEVRAAPNDVETVYLGSTGGFFASLDGGAVWEARDSDLARPFVTSVVADGQIPKAIYAATFHGFASVFASADAGQEWREISSESLQLAPLSVGLSGDPSRGGVLYGWTGECTGSVSYQCFGTIRRTLDGGSTWETLTSVPGAVNGLVVDPVSSSTLYASFRRYRDPEYLGLEDLPMKSTDSGSMWALMEGLPELSMNLFVVDPHETSRVYSAGGDAGVFVSSNGGETWTPTNDGLTDLRVVSLVLDPSSPSVLYAGTSSGIFSSVDRGQTWDQTSLALAPIALVVHPRNGIVFAATSEGVFQSFDQGAHWSDLNARLGTASVSGLAVDSSGAFLHAGTSAGVLDLRLGPATRTLPER